ncbi:MAG TPA: rod shape-determining protein MreC [Syntrophorhabdales bacterium]|nr:rod shape-determining protein MreC [Syntrophorhabdales bacterium]
MKGTLVVITAVVILAVSFLLFSDIGPVAKRYSRAKVYFANVVGPTLRGVSAPFRFTHGMFDGYINLVDVKRKNGELQKKLAVLQLQNQKLAELEKENERLRRLLHFMDQSPGTLIAARVIGEDVTNWFKCIIIDKGHGNGIREKMPVITPEGVVGQAVEVDQWHTKVMILIDTNSAIDVYVTGKQARGILAGTGRTTLKMKYVLKNDDIETGDRLITSGKDGIYPRGLPVGVVISVDKNVVGLFAEVEVMPFNNFRKLDEVLVVRK